MLQLTRSQPELNARSWIRMPASGNWRHWQIVVSLWRLACHHAERPDRVVPYY